jgi:sugar O-acyltransferase (sialic acid O-acetyltransferase NeuD family)
MDRIFILGAGGFARELRAYLHVVRPDAAVWLVSRDGEADALFLAQYETEVARYGEDCVTYLGAGHCDARARMMAELRGRLGPPVVLTTSNWCQEIGAGSVMANGVVLAPGCRVGESVLVNYNATIGHDSVVGDLSVIAPQAAVGGFCELGARVYVGAGATIRERTRVGADAIIGMGAVVTKDVPPGVLVVNVNEIRPRSRETA